MGDFFVGTSGFASPAMRGSVPSQGASAPELLAAYATIFASVELDSVFYRRPGAETIANWWSATHDGFRFAVRVPREITHVDLLRIPEAAATFRSSLEPLGIRLGALLFTTPPTFEADPARLRSMLEALGDVRTAWEFRHPSWFRPEVFEILAERDACPVMVEAFEETLTRDLLPGGALADRYEFPFVYVRFRRETYTYADLVVWGDMLADVIGEGRDVYAFYRQSPEAAAYATALNELLAEAKAATFSDDGLAAGLSAGLTPAPRASR